MLSRVADSVYWMDRYRERAENTARLIDVNLHLTLDMPGEEIAQWEPLLKTTRHEKFFKEKYGVASDDNVIEFMTFDTENPDSILSCLHQCRENARAIRETIMIEMWQEINTLYLFVKRAKSDRSLFGSPHQFYNRIRRQCQLFSGISHDSMAHNYAWHFGRLGSLLERADMTSRFLDLKYFIILPSREYIGSEYDNLQWTALLRSLSAHQMYHQLWHAIHYVNVVDFLVLNRNFPRSISFCVSQARQSLQAVLIRTSGHQENQPLTLLDKLKTDLEFSEAQKIIEDGLHEFLDNTQIRLNLINDAIYKTFFASRPLEATPLSGA